jgi:hypothetical protein
VAGALTATPADRWAHDRAFLAEHEPGLSLLLDEQANTARIAGAVRVPRNDGRHEEFQIEVRYPGLDPFEVPDCYDPTDRFPRLSDRHVEESGRFCLWPRWLAPVADFRAADGLALYLTRVQEFLALQLQYEARERRGLKPYWPGEAWAHGDAAFHEWLEATTSRLNTNQLHGLLSAAQRMAKADRRCPCGSGKPISSCHQRWLRHLRAAWSWNPATRTATYDLLEARRART